VGHVGRIQISPDVDDEEEAEEDADEEAEQAIVFKSPSFTFADCTWPGWKGSRSHAEWGSGSGHQPPLIAAGRAVKAEVKLLVKTADVGREAIEIRSIREFVELDPLPSASGPFSRIFQTEADHSGFACGDSSAPMRPVTRRNRTRLLVTPVHPSGLGKPLPHAIDRMLPASSGFFRMLVIHLALLENHSWMDHSWIEHGIVSR